MSGSWIVIVRERASRRRWDIGQGYPDGGRFEGVERLFGNPGDDLPCKTARQRSLIHHHQPAGFAHRGKAIVSLRGTRVRKSMMSAPIPSRSSVRAALMASSVA